MRCSAVNLERFPTPPRSNVSTQRGDDHAGAPTHVTPAPGVRLSPDPRKAAPSGGQSVQSLSAHDVGELRPVNASPAGRGDRSSDSRCAVMGQSSIEGERPRGTDPIGQGDEDRGEESYLTITYAQEWSLGSRHERRRRRRRLPVAFGHSAPRVSEELLSLPPTIHDGVVKNGLQIPYRAGQFFAPTRIARFVAA